jgi:hypothetical protein
MSDLLSTEQSTDGDQWKVTDALLLDYNSDRTQTDVILHKVSSEVSKANHDAKVKGFFSSVEDSTCRWITIVLLSVHAKYPFLNIARSKTLCPLLRLCCNKCIFMLLFVQYFGTQRKKILNIWV